MRSAFFIERKGISQYGMEECREDKIIIRRREIIMRRKGLLLAMTAVMAVCMTACGKGEGTSGEAGKKTEAAKEDEIGTVIVGIDGTYPPFNYMGDDGEPTGFEIEMIQEISKRAGLDIKLQTVPWDGVFGQLDAGKIDTYACCIFPNEERQEKYLFSREYIYDENRFIVREGDGGLYKTYKDLEGHKIGVAGGGNSILAVEKLQERENLNFEIVAYNNENYVNDLALGRLDIIYKSPVSAMVESKSLGVGFEVAECPTVEEASCALPWRKDDARSEKICEMFSKATQEMIDDGTMKELCDKWLEVDVTAYDPLLQ